MSDHRSIQANNPGRWPFRLSSTACYLLIGLGLLSQTGCLKIFNRTATPPKPRPEDLMLEDQIPTTANLVSYLNKSGELADQKINILNVDDLYIDASAQGRSAPGVSGSMVCQSPRNFRLEGKVAGITQVDFGSNKDRFWFWIKQSDDPSLFHLSYADYEKGVPLPFPFQPEWVLEVLGMAEYPSVDNFRMEVKDRTFELVQSTSLQGRPVQKVVVFDRRRKLLEGEPRVQSYSVKDEQGKLICSATILQTKYDRSGIEYPRKIRLEWPAEQMKMTLTLDDVTINQPIPSQQAAKNFNLPNWRHVKNVDLADRMRGYPSSNIRQARGQR